MTKIGYQTFSTDRLSLIRNMTLAIKQSRKAKGWTQRDLAKQAKTTQSSVARAEAGYQALSTNNFMWLMEVMDVDIRISIATEVEELL